MTQLILASSSPRRRELLAHAGYKFEVLTAPVKEGMSRHLSLRELTTLNATRKALALAQKKPEAIILAADTLVSLEGEIIGKPASMKQGRTFLRRLSGRVHEVCTAVFINGPGRRFISFTEISRVEFRRLTECAIDVYLARINPLDKAGAYAAQGMGAEIIAGIEGSVTNVIGLPMERTSEALKEFGVLPNCRSALRNAARSSAFPPPPPSPARPQRAPVPVAARDRGTKQ
jgi:septum formation protein